MFWIFFSPKSIIGYFKNCWAINGVLVCSLIPAFRFFESVRKKKMIWNKPRKKMKAKDDRIPLSIWNRSMISAVGSIYGVECVTVGTLTKGMTIVLFTCAIPLLSLSLQIGSDFCWYVSFSHVFFLKFYHLRPGFVSIAMIPVALVFPIRERK